MRPSAQVAATTVPTMTAAPRSPIAESVSQEQVGEQGVNTGSPVSSSDTVVEERRSSARLCRKNARQVENSAKNTMMLPATDAR